MYKTKVLSTGIYAPEKVMTNDDIAQLVDTSDKWITERTGIKRRHVSSAEKKEWPGNMATWASEKAIKEAGIKPDDIDLILYASVKSDYPLPNTATLLQQQLGITNKCGALDISAACSGFVYGFNMADSFIKTGLAKTVLVVGSELLTTEIDWEDRSTCILFGDGCGVAILSRTPEDEGSEVLGAVMGADGSGRDFFHMNYGGHVIPMTKEILESKDRFMKMNGQEMFKVAVRTLAKNSQIVMEQGRVNLEDIDWVVPHQANIRIIESTASLLNIPMEKVIVNIEEYGNTSAATVPLAFHEAIHEGKIKRGDMVLFTAFGAGLTSAATLLRY